MPSLGVEGELERLLYHNCNMFYLIAIMVIGVSILSNGVSVDRIL